jgi:uncharacterized protein (DUF58 family)
MGGTNLGQTHPGEGLAEVLEEVRRIEVITRRLYTDLMAGGYLSVFRGSGIEFEGVREYVEGDDPRAVDGSVTARMGRPFVKTYVPERELTLIFLLDLSASMDGGFSAWSARQTAARVCACFALSAARNGDKVGLAAFSSGVDAWVPPAKGPGHALRIVRDCLALPRVSARTDAGPALSFVARTVRRHAVVFLLSDFLADGWQRPLALCARRHDVIAVRLQVPELAEPPRALLRVQDPESGASGVVDLRPARGRDAWARRVGAWNRRTEQDLRRARVDLMDVPVPRTASRDAVVDPIRRFFRMRELRGTKR